MTKGFFITSTDTGVGKTVFTVALGRRLLREGRSVAALKPVATGCELTPDGLRNEDALLLQRTISPTLSYEQINPYAYAPPISPHLAAALAGRPIDLATIERQVQSVGSGVDCVLVEGVGGWEVPLDSDGTRLSHLAVRLRLPVILVVGIKLGCINHALLTCAAIECSGLPLAGWVANLNAISPLALGPLVNSLQVQIPAPLLGILPQCSPLVPNSISAYLRTSALF